MVRPTHSTRIPSGPCVRCSHALPLAAETQAHRSHPPPQRLRVQAERRVGDVGGAAKQREHLQGGVHVRSPRLCPQMPHFHLRTSPILRAVVTRVPLLKPRAPEVCV